jgi:mannan endo-1,4-beta-mannosidase
MTIYVPARWPQRYRSPQERRRHRAFVTMATAVVVAVAAGGVLEILTSPDTSAWGPGHPVVIALPTRPASYIGAYVPGVPTSYAPMNSFSTANGVRPNIAPYYSRWGEPFMSEFAVKAAAHHAVPLAQIDPGNVSLAGIAAGRYDSYLRAFAEAVGEFGQRTGRGVIIGFGQQPNDFWHLWGYRYISPRVWIHAWRHVVTLFRRAGADDVTWLWTVTAIDLGLGDISPDRWWPGPGYVTWVGIDGYYFRPSTKFASLFGPTIKAIRSLTRDPILVSETGAQAKAGKPVKIADVFRGVRSYGLLGLVWFDVRPWRLNTRACAAAFAIAAKNWRLTG